MWLVLALLLAGDLFPTHRPAGDIEFHVPGATIDGAQVEAAAFSPDGRHAATGDLDGTIRIWDVQSGIEVRSLRHQRSVAALVFSADGKRLVSGGFTDVSIWDLTSGAQLHKYEALNGSLISAVALSPDGSRILVGEDDGAISLVDANTATLVSALATNAPPLLNNHPDNLELAILAVRARRGLKITALAFSADGKQALSIGSGTRLWDLASGAATSALAQEDPAERIAGGAFSADGKGVWDLGKGLRHLGLPMRTVSVAPVAMETMSAAAFGSGIGRVLVGGADSVFGRVALLALDDKGTVLAKSQVPTRVTAVALSRDGKRAIVGELSGKVGFWDVDAGEMRPRAGMPRAQPLHSVAFSPDGRTLVTSNGVPADGIVLWDLTAARSETLLRHSRLAGPVAFTPDGRFLISPVGTAEGLRVIDLSTGTAASQLASGLVQNALAVSPDGHLVATGSPDSIHLWTLEGGKLSPAPDAGATGAKQWVSSLAFSADGAVLLAGGTDRSVHVWDVATRALRLGLEAKNPVTSVAISPDGKLGLIATTDQTLWDLTTGKAVRTLESEHYECNAASFSPDGARALLGFQDGAIVVWDVATGKIVRQLKAHAGAINGLAFSRDGAFFASASSDGSARVWNSESFESVALVLSPNGVNDWVAFTSDGYWDASRTGGDLVVANRGLDVLGLDQLAPYSNRPDLIIERLGHADPRHLEHLKQVEARRLRKLGLPETPQGALEMPTATITDARQQGRVIALDIALEASDAAPLKSYSIFVNDVPIHGALGIPVTGRTKQLTAKIELAAGSNKIEVSCLNTRGIEATRAVTFARADAAPKRNLYFVGFGVSKYRDPALDLGWADKDVRDLASLFASMKGSAAFNEVRIKTYVNEEVEPAAFASAKAFLAGATVDDALILFIAGHGVHDRDPAATYYFLTHGADPANLSKTAAAFETVEEVLQGVAPRRKLFLMDTCESGELEAAVAERQAATASEQGIHGRGLKRAPRAAAAANQPRPFLGERDRFLYNDLSRRSGAIVLSAAGGGELSYESDAVSNGFFTKAIVEAFSGSAADANGDGALSVAELRDFVAAKVARQTGGLQNPSIDRDNIYQPFELPLSRATSAAPGPAADPGQRAVVSRSGQFTVVSQAGAMLVLDSKTGLTWRKELGPPVKWAAATEDCRARRDGGYDDWRLPSIDELRSIMLAPWARTGGDCRVTNDCLLLSCWDVAGCWGVGSDVPPACQWNKDVFSSDEDCMGLGVWTSSSVADDPSQVFGAALRGGLIGPREKETFPERVACVRRTTQ